MSDVDVVALVGSLRKDSFNRHLYNAARELAPAGMRISELTGWHKWPVLDMDIVSGDGMPDEVAETAARISAADAILFVSPEYNYSIPGGLKNAIDWVSRVTPGPLTGKPVAIMGASSGKVGTARMQYHLRQVMVFVDANPINKPEVMIGPASAAFDDDGKLTDDFARDLVAKQLATLAHAVERANVPCA